MKRAAILQTLLFLITASIPLSSMAQKEVRKNIRKGNKVYQEQKYSEAADYFGKAVEENPQSKEATFNLGNTYYRQKEWDKATEQYQQFVTLEQENPEEAAAGWHNIGNARLQKKDLQQAMEAYKMSLRINPNDDETRYNLAVVQKMIRDQQDDQQDQSEQQQDQQQDQQQEQQPQNQPQEDKRAEQPDQPEQMSRDNARQLLQAIEQDEQQTQKKVQQIKAQEREQKAEDNRRNNRNW